MTENNRNRTLAFFSLLALTSALIFVGATEVAAKDQKEHVAAPGPCAKPRELSRGADPADAAGAPAVTPNETFDIAGSPADRLNPAQVAASMPIPGGGPGAPAAPGAPGVGLCDSPDGCGVPTGPAFSEPPPGTPTLPFP